MLPIKLLSFALKASVAIFFHLYKIDILNIRTGKGSPLDSNISTFVVASCVACMFSRINLSPHLQSISRTLVYVLEFVLTLYGTETAMYLIWLPLLKGLLWISSKITETFTRSRHKSPADVQTSNCIESDLFCYLNICMAMFIASNTLASFGWIKNLKALWKSIIASRKNAIPETQAMDMTPKIMNNTIVEDAVKAVYQVRPKRRPIMLMNVR